MSEQDRRLIEDYLPIEAISEEASREKSVRKGHISTLHLWWARRPLVACRAAVYGALVPASQFVPENGPDNKKQSLGRANAARFVTDAQSPLGVKIKVTEEMTGPLFYKFLMSEKQATGTFVLPNNPGDFDALATTQALTDMFAGLNEGASAKKALTIFAEVMRS